MTRAEWDLEYTRTLKEFYESYDDYWINDEQRMRNIEGAIETSLNKIVGYVNKITKLRSLKAAYVPKEE